MSVIKEFKYLCLNFQLEHQRMTQQLFGQRKTWQKLGSEKMKNVLKYPWCFWLYQFFLQFENFFYVDQIRTQLVWGKSLVVKCEIHCVWNSLWLHVKAIPNANNIFLNVQAISLLFCEMWMGQIEAASLVDQKLKIRFPSTNIACKPF